jgi:hypothetical protein
MSMQVDSQEEAEWRRVLSLLTAIVLLVAAAVTITIVKRASSSDVEFDIMAWVLFRLIPVSPYVFLFLCSLWMKTELRALWLLGGSVVISGFGVLMVWLTVTQGTDPLRFVGLLFFPGLQWGASVLLVACLWGCTRPAGCGQIPVQESDDTSE